MNKTKIAIIVASVLIAIVALSLVAINIFEPTGYVVKRQKSLERIDFLIDWTHTPDYVAYYVAKEKGFFEEQGFDVNIIEGSGGSDAAKLLSSGKYDIGTTTASSLNIINSKGGNIKSVAAIYQKTPTAILSLSKSGIRKPTDLYGKRLGYNPSSMTAQEYAAFAEKLNLDRSRIDELQIGWGKEELIAGKIDARVDWITDVYVDAKTEGFELNVIWLPDYGFEEYGEVIAVNKEYMIQNPEKVKRMTKAIIKGWEYTLDNKDEATIVFTQLFPEINKQFTRNALDEIDKLTGTGGLGYQEKNVWFATQEMLYGQGMIDHKVSLDSLYTNEFLS